MGLDRELLSAYIDGEIPEPWKSRITARIENEADTKQAYDELLYAHRVLKNDSTRIEENLVPQGEEVLSKIYATLESGGAKPAKTSPFSVIRRGGIFSWRMSLPLPAAAAAALVLMFSLGFGLASLSRTPRMDNQVADLSAAQAQAQVSQVLDQGFLNPVASRGSAGSTAGSTPQGFYSRTSFDGLPLSVDQLMVLQQALDQMKTGPQTALPGVTITVQDLSQLIQILQGTGRIREITIEMPEQRNLELIGEPALVTSSGTRQVPPGLDFSPSAEAGQTQSSENSGLTIQGNSANE